MITQEEIEKRLETTEATLQSMLCTVTADLIMFQAAVTSLREDGVLNERMIDRMAIDAQSQLQQYNTPALSAPMVAEIASQLNGLAERLRRAMPSVPLIDPATVNNDYGRGGPRRPGR